MMARSWNLRLVFWPDGQNQTSGAAPVPFLGFQVASLLVGGCPAIWIVFCKAAFHIILLSMQ
jgi:hypothetical protein